MRKSPCSRRDLQHSGRLEWLCHRCLLFNHLSDDERDFRSRAPSAMSPAWCHTQSLSRPRLCPASGVGETDWGAARWETRAICGCLRVHVEVWLPADW